MRRAYAGIITLVLLLGVLFGGRAAALPVAPEPVDPVQGIPEPCPVTHPWPGDDASMDEIKTQLAQNFGFDLVGKQWTNEYRDAVQIVWETLDAVSCTTYIDVMKTKADVGLNANPIRGYAWGDWSLTKAGYVSLDFAKFQRALDSGDEGRLTRLDAHELAHVLNSDRFSEPQYWRDFKALYAREGRFSDYAGSKTSEIFADVVGYYVGRCALNNPYDTGKFSGYYEFVKDNVFDGKEFGPAPGEKPNCTVPKRGAEEPRPGKPTDTKAKWISDLAGE